MDASRATAGLGALHGPQVEPRDRIQQGARLLADPLPVAEVAGIVPTHGSRQVLGSSPGQVPAQALEACRLGQVLGQVADALSERLGPLGPCGVVGQEAAVLAEVGAAAGGIHDQREGSALTVDQLLEALDRLPRQRPRPL